MRPTRIAAAFAFLIAASSVARAQDYEAAGKHFASGQELFGKGQYKKAAEEFEQAYKITKDPVLLYNIGESFEKAGSGKNAVLNYRQYVAEQPQASDRAEVEKRIAALEKKYKIPPAKVEPKAEPKPEPAKTEPAKPEPAKPEPAKPEPVKEKLMPMDSTPAPTTPPPAKEPLLQLDSTPQATEPPPATTPPPAPATAEPPKEPAAGLLDEDHPSTVKVVAWIGVATTVALLTAGAIFGLAAQSRSDEITRRELQVDASGQPPKYDMMTESQFQQLASEGKTYDAVGISLLTGAGVVAVISGVLFFVDHRSKANAETHVRLAPSFGPHNAGAQLKLEF